MKNTFILFAILLFPTFGSNAQSFTVQHDTVRSTPIEFTLIPDDVTATSDSVTIQWRVITSNFPADWIPPTGICDNYICYPLPTLWPGGSSRTSEPYTTTLGDFHLQTDLTTVTDTGCYYLTVRMNNRAIPTDTATETYILCKPVLTVAVTNVVETFSKVALYPNPANNEISIVYDVNADVKNIIVYDIAGRIVILNKTSNSPYTLNLENVPSGVYFVKLFNSKGEIIVTSKFMKQ